MKKLLFLFFIVSTNFSIFSQNYFNVSTPPFKGNSQNYSKRIYTKAVDSVVTYIDNIGNKKTAFVFDGWGNTIAETNYNLDAATNKWVGIDSTVSVYQKDGNRNILNEFVIDPTTKKWIPLQSRIDTFNTDGFVIKTYTFDNWNSSTNDWNIKEKIFRTYNENNQETYYIHQKYIDNQWINYKQATKEYNANGNRTLDQVENYNTSTLSWQGSYKITYSYDVSNNLLNITRYEWENDDWTNNYKTDYTYNSSNNKIQEIKMNWDGNYWTYTTKYVYDYDVNQNMILKIYYKSHNNITDEWIGDYKIIKEYDTENRNTLYEKWKWDENNDFPGSDWIGRYKKNYEYSTNQEIKIEQNWDLTTNTFVNSDKYIIQFDENYNQTNYTELTWNDANNSWDNVYKEEYTYNSNEDYLSENYYSWDSENNDWFKYKVISYTYNGDKLINKQTAEKNIGDVYFLVYYILNVTFDNSNNATNANEESFYATNNYHRVADYTYDTQTNADDIMFTYGQGAYNFYTTYANLLNIDFESMMIESNIVDTNNVSGNITNKKVKFYYSQAPVNIKEDKKQIYSQALIFPNPTNDFVTFSFNSNSNNNRLEIFDICGKKIIEQKIENNQNISIKNLKSGIYIYKIKTNSSQIFQGKISKQ